MNEVTGFAVVDDPIVVNPGASARGWHRLQLFSECPQKFAFSTLLPRPEVEPTKPALATGSLVHLLLAQHFMRMKMEQEGKNPNEYMEPVEAVRLVAEVRGHQAFVDRILSVYEPYRMEYWKDIHERMIFGVEELHDGSVGPYRLTGRIDLLWKDLGGNLHALDHKSTGRLTAQHKHYFTLSGQFQAYSHLVRQRYGDLLSFEIGLVQHTTPKFLRITLPRSPLIERQFVQQVVGMEQRIEQLMTENRAVDEWPKAMSELTCFHRYGACEHLDKCRFGSQANCAGSFKVAF